MSRFWKLPESKQLLTTELASNPLLRSLWKQHLVSGVSVNAVTTLPKDIMPKDEIFKQIADENPQKLGFSLKVKQTMAYGKTLMGFYKAGVVNVWNNNKEYKKLKTLFKIDNQVADKGKSIATRVTNFKKLNHEMSQMLYMSRIENKTLNDNTSASTVVNHDKETVVVDANLFLLARNQYQLINRTPKDFLKLPTFAVIFAICMECTPLLCYAFPEITPLTCILPSILPRLWNPANTEKVSSLTKELLQNTSKDAVASLTAYNLDLELVQSLNKSLNLVSRYIPVTFYPESVLRDRLQNHYNYLMVDNYFLSGLNGGGNVWDLAYPELVIACLERNLISNLKQSVTQFDHIKDETEKLQFQTQHKNELRSKLVRFIMDFDNFNVGYLCLNEHLHPVNSKKLVEWH